MEKLKGQQKEAKTMAMVSNVVEQELAQTEATASIVVQSPKPIQEKFVD